jgi:hypothetical protein
MDTGKLTVAVFLVAGLCALVWGLALAVVRAEYNLNWFAIGVFCLLGAAGYRRHLRARRRS